MPKWRYTMGNQQPRPEQGKVQRLSRMRVGLQADGGSKWCVTYKLLMLYIKIEYADLY